MLNTANLVAGGETLDLTVRLRLVAFRTSLEASYRKDAQVALALADKQKMIESLQQSFAECSSKCKAFAPICKEI